MNLMSKIDSIAQSYFPTFSAMFRKPSDQVPDGIPSNSQEDTPKIYQSSLRRLNQNSKPKMVAKNREPKVKLNHIRRTFLNATNPRIHHSNHPRVFTRKSFLLELYIREIMSVFDPKDYTKSSNQESLYDTVMEVQKVLQEITQLLEAQELENEQVQTSFQQHAPQFETKRPSISSEEYSEEEPNYTIYDDIFE